MREIKEKQKWKRMEKVKMSIVTLIEQESLFSVFLYLPFIPPLHLLPQNSSLVAGETHLLWLWT
jgi:hypothetical protein